MEVLSKSGKSAERVAGNLRRNLAAWAKMGASEFILDTIETGYKIPFYKTPHSAYFKNNRSAMRNREFVSNEINELLSTGRIRKVPNPPTIVNPLSVSENGDKKRLILDLRYNNGHIWKEHVKYEDFRTLREYLSPGAVMFSFDFQSGYHHVEIFEEHCQYLGFLWSEGGKTSFYVFLVLPFGLSTAGYIFTKICRVLVKFWRSHGIKIVIYLDDGIGVVETFLLCQETANFVKKSIEDAGFIINEMKSNWFPSQIRVWLGLLIDTLDFSIKIPEKRILKLFSKIQSLLMHKKSSARKVASVAGSVISHSIVMGNITALFTRNMFTFITNARGWDISLLTPNSVTDELKFWLANTNHLNTRMLGSSPGPPLQAVAIANSDASSVASGAVVKIEGTSHTAHKNLSPEEIDRSSTWRELDAILFSVVSMSTILRNRMVVWATDNQAAVWIKEKGSKKPYLQKIAKEIYYACRRNQIDLHLVWVPREFNEQADAISKDIDYDDWKTAGSLFEYFNRSWGPYDIDRFANHKNHKTHRFNSRYWSPGCEAVDAFTQDWSGSENWLVPPIHLIPRTIRHANRCKAKGTLIAPLWKSAPFWPMLCYNGSDFYEFVQDVKIFPDARGLLEVGDFKKTLLGSARFVSPLIAIKLAF